LVIRSCDLLRRLCGEKRYSGSSSYRAIARGARVLPVGAEHDAYEIWASGCRVGFSKINADDYYGKDAFVKMAKFLTTEASDDIYSLVGYQIDKTLSDYGSVSRGVCEVNEKGDMTEVNERTEVYFKEDGSVAYKDATGEHPLPNDKRVSMNFWGFTPAVFEQSLPMFQRFVEANENNPKAEFFIPLVADELIKSGTAAFKVIPTASKWFGVTYKEDKPIVQKSISALVENGTYPTNLWS